MLINLNYFKNKYKKLKIKMMVYLIKLIKNYQKI